ncbi:MAG: hypothetical protein JSS02_02355 [Planctomycetes bacterium]|nr:hypothetical protein [Planctomycetota bacterium]
MAKRPKYRAEDFPAVGSVILAPLADGRLCAGRVLRNQMEGGAQAVLVEVSRWIGTEPPALDLPELRETLSLTHHSHQGKPERFWTWDLVPPSFRVLGQIKLSAADRARKCSCFSGWQGMPLQVLMQWRWDHDREALERELAAAAEKEAEIRRQQAARRAEYMKSLTLETLAEREWFADWDSENRAVPVAECRQLFRTLVAELRAVPRLTSALVKKQVQQSVATLNSWQSPQSWIATIEREDLIEAYEQILCAAKYPLLIHQVERWREW